MQGINPAAPEGGEKNLHCKCFRFFVRAFQILAQNKKEEVP
jgi:hypothetical protein